ncbi:gastrula zinc finger protein XlCGF57.1-like isoform X2 [Pseudoliparis swirei]|uniref:gastrula zinc finger protein XlCGF57.1-like isoform X2 n=1 Tax=Pseudoliparis swirei TaxID=2059687 RepID=UPI0024BE2F34|nr:gastrula zinc finger protein XlCGF57.1-like isoform X2 [Pseudoliparis swirei]
MSKLRAVKSLVAERLAAAAEEISSAVEKKLQLTSDMTPEQQRAAVHQRLSVVADEIFRILEKMFSEYEADVSGSLEENEGGPPLSPAICEEDEEDKEDEEDASSGKSGSPSRVQRTSALPRSKDASTEADCAPIHGQPSHLHRTRRAESVMGTLAPSDHDVPSSNDSEPASEDDDDDETNGKRLKSNKSRTFERRGDGEDYCEMCGRSFLQSAAGKKLPKQERKMSATTKIQATGRSCCRVCGKLFRYKRSFLKHVLAHEQTSDLCGACGKHLDADESLKVHLQTHGEENRCRDPAGDGRSEAEGSDGESPAGDEEWRHGDGSDGGSDASDAPCSRKSKTEGATEPRGAGHPGPADPTPLKHRCRVCGKFFCYRASFLKHVQEDEADADLCGVCGKRFDSEDGLRRHLQAYARTDDCEVCGKHFDGRKQLEMHKRTHTGEKPYVCSVCGKAFAQSGNLAGHMRAHTGERPYACSVCGQSFGFKEYMTAHMRIHTGEKPFLCSVCGKGFRQRGTLKTHTMIHTGESAHRCAVCGKKFSKSGALKIHMRSHTGEKPYLCTVCGKSFTASGSLAKHTGAHEGARGGELRRRRARAHDGDAARL